MHTRKSLIKRTLALWSILKTAQKEKRRSRPLVDTEPAGTLTLDLLASRTVRNKCYLRKKIFFKPNKIKIKERKKLLRSK